MLNKIQRILEFKSKLNLEQIYNLFIVFIIVFILILAIYARIRPIDHTRIIKIQEISNQSKYPQTQDMALQLLQQNKISFGQYLKLMQAHYIESHRAIQLPPVQQDHIKR